MHRACYLGEVRLVGPGLVMAMLVFALGCAGGNQAHVLSQASADMSCPPERTVIVDDEVGIYRVRGCGQEAGYRCPEMGSHCRRTFLQALPEPAEPAPAVSQTSSEEF